MVAGPCHVGTALILAHYRIVAVPLVHMCNRRRGRGLEDLGAVAAAAVQRGRQAISRSRQTKILLSQNK
jgi:hypothetical protein